MNKTCTSISKMNKRIYVCAILLLFPHHRHELNYFAAQLFLQSFTFFLRKK